MLKPDAVQRGLVGEILGRFERRGLKLVALKLVHVTPEFAHKHYAVHAGKPFFEGLIKYITSGPVVAMVLEGTSAIEVARATMGATNPAKAAPGTVRADFALEMGRNLVHGSDGPETAAFEIGLWFGPEALLNYDRSVDPWIFE
jgi:nucleoside-diphosphate kinase